MYLKEWTVTTYSSPMKKTSTMCFSQSGWDFVARHRENIELEHMDFLTEKGKECMRTHEIASMFDLLIGCAWISRGAKDKQTRVMKINHWLENTIFKNEGGEKKMLRSVSSHLEELQELIFSRFNDGFFCC